MGYGYGTYDSTGCPYRQTHRLQKLIDSQRVRQYNVDLLGNLELALEGLADGLQSIRYAGLRRYSYDETNLMYGSRILCRRIYSLLNVEIVS